MLQYPYRYLYIGIHTVFVIQYNREASARGNSVRRTYTGASGCRSSLFGLRFCKIMESIKKYAPLNPTPTHEARRIFKRAASGDGSSRSGTAAASAPGCLNSTMSSQRVVDLSTPSNGGTGAESGSDGGSSAKVRNPSLCCVSRFCELGYNSVARMKRFLGLEGPPRTADHDVVRHIVGIEVRLDW